MTVNIDLSEKSLKTDLNELSALIVHDFYVLCRKAGIYTVNHPVALKAVETPFRSLQKIFAFKKYFFLFLTEGKLYANNILMTETSVVDYLKDRLQDVEINSLLIDLSVTADQLLKLAGRLSQRVATTHPDYHISRFLTSHKIDSVLVDDELAIKMFQSGLRYRGNIRDDFSVRRVVANYFSGEIDQAIGILSNRFDDTGQQARATGIDFHTQIVNHILPEKFSQLQPAELIEVAQHIMDTLPTADRKEGDQLARLVRSFDYHPKREQLLEQLRDLMAMRGIEVATFSGPLSESGKLNLESVQAIDNIKSDILAHAEFDESKYAAFDDAFMKLIRTRQMGKLARLSEDLVEYLGADKEFQRRHAVYLLNRGFRSVMSYGEFRLLDVILDKLQYLFTRGKETFEFSEVTVELLRALLSSRRYESVAAFLNVLKSGRKNDDEIMVYDSITIKKIFDGLNDTELIRRLVYDLQLKDAGQSQHLRDILTAIQSEEVALQLSEIVAHPDRGIRHRCLKILSELGKPAVKVFSEILRDEANFYRVESCRELPDKRWFLVRNAIFVLGNLADPDACNALRLRLADSDTRVGREIVSALEKIGGDEAADLLMIMCENSAQEVRQPAIIALGMMKRSDLAPFFIDLLYRKKTDAARIIGALALTGASESREFLVDLIEDKEKLKALSSGKASINDIRSYIIKALEKIGDDSGLERAREAINAQARDKGKPGEIDLGKTARLILQKIQAKK